MRDILTWFSFLKLRPCVNLRKTLSSSSVIYPQGSAAIPAGSLRRPKAASSPWGSQEGCGQGMRWHSGKLSQSEKGR